MDHRVRHVCLFNLGNGFFCRFRTLGPIDDLERAIETMEQAVESIPKNHPSRAKYLNTLGEASKTLFEHVGSVDDLNHASDALDTPFSAPITKDR